MSLMRIYFPAEYTNTRARWLPLMKSNVSSNVSFVDDSLKSDNYFTSNEDFSCGYVGEPDYNEEKLKSIKFSSSSKNENSNKFKNEFNSSRLENLHWCKCSHCTVIRLVTSEEFFQQPKENNFSSY